jgi:CRISPR-associated protein Cas1
MKQLLNTLFVQAQGTYVRLDHETIKLDVERETKLQVPLQHLGGLAVFGNVLLSPFLLHRFAEDGRSVVWFGRGGKFKGRLAGPTTGNVLLRRAQYEAQADPDRSSAIARNVVAGKLRNTRSIVQRAARESEEPDAAVLESASSDLADTLRDLSLVRVLDDVRGLEGRAGRTYFEVLRHMIRADRAEYAFNGRNRRPPRDRVNALLSFVYALVLSDCVAGCEGVGLDPQFGYLHALRPGRPSLALDLMEEFRPVLADRLVLSLINRRQLRTDDFEDRPGGAVQLNESGRKTVISAYQKRKQEEINHPILNRQVPLGLVPHIQARLLARHLRGDAAEYMPFTPR